MARKRSSHGRGRGRKEKKVFPQVVGRVQMTREGYAFVIVEGEEDDEDGLCEPDTEADSEG